MGHNPLRDEGEPCYCGRRGCIETVLAGPALERHYQGRTGASVRLPEIAARVALRAGRGRDPRAAFVKFGEAIAAVTISSIPTPS